MSERDSTSRGRQLPSAVEGRLGELAGTLRSQLGDNLVSLLVFGSAVRGGWAQGRSDVDLVLVLREPSHDALLSISNTLTVARTALRFEAVILSADEISRAADVFPLFYDDIRSCHVLLAGKDVFADLEISDKHRRLRIEQELRAATDDTLPALLEKAEETWGVDVAPLSDVRKDPAAALAALNRLLDCMVDEADRMEG